MWFDIRRSPNTALRQRYWWVAVGANGEKLSASEMLSTKKDCIKAIRTLKEGAATASVYDETGEVLGDIEKKRILV